MIKTIRKTLQDRKHGNIAILSILCVSVIGLSMIFFVRNDNPAEEGNSPETVNMEEDPQVPLGSIATKISAGDTVVLRVFADEMENVYGYQFDLNFDRDIIDYKKRLYSDIDDIITIFATDKEWYLLVGATMIGDAEGYTGREVPVCRVEFVALVDFELNADFSSDHIALSGVNIVTGDLQYLENVEGWTASMALW